MSLSLLQCFAKKKREKKKEKAPRTENLSRSSDFKGRAPFVGFFNFTTPYLLIIDPELVKQIMIKDFKSFRNNEFSSLVSLKNRFGNNGFDLLIPLDA